MSSNINTRLDIEYFNTYNTKILGITDTSFYNKRPIKNAKFYIQVPGFDTPVQVKFQKSRINRFNSRNLALSFEETYDKLNELPDGIYKFKYEGEIDGEEYSIDKSLLRVEKLQYRYKEAVKSLNINLHDNGSKIREMNELIEIHFLILTAISYSNDCDIRNALDFYRLADKKLDKFLNCC